MDRKAVAPFMAPGSQTTLVRPHSPIMGRADAPVTIVEFFDPACETCRAFYPIVKKIMAEHPGSDTPRASVCAVPQRR